MKLKWQGAGRSGNGRYTEQKGNKWKGEWKWKQIEGKEGGVEIAGIKQKGNKWKVKMGIENGRH